MADNFQAEGISLLKHLPDLLRRWKDQDTYTYKRVPSLAKEGSKLLATFDELTILNKGISQSSKDDMQDLLVEKMCIYTTDQHTL